MAGDIAADTVRYHLDHRIMTPILTHCDSSALFGRLGAFYRLFVV